MSESRPPYTAVIFTSRRAAGSQEAAAAYDATTARMLELAAEQPGYLGVESARSPDGTGITVSYWRTAEDAAAWGRVGEHLLAQARGAREWYAAYTVRVATVEREHGFSRDQP